MVDRGRVFFLRPETSGPFGDVDLWVPWVPGGRAGTAWLSGWRYAGSSCAADPGLEP